MKRKRESGQERRRASEQEVKVTVQDLCRIAAKVAALKWKTYDFELWVDCHEPAELFRLYFDNLKVKYIERNLPKGGDIYFVLRDRITGECKLWGVIERKSTSDLFSSIRDKKEERKKDPDATRYRSQKAKLIRLAKTLRMPRNRIFYLIEKSFVHTKNWMSQDTLKGAKTNTEMRDKMTILETSDQVDTIYTVLHRITKIHQFLSLYKAELEQQLTLEAAHLYDSKTETWISEDQMREKEMVSAQIEEATQQTDSLPSSLPPTSSSSTDRSDSNAQYKVARLQFQNIPGIARKKAEAILTRFTTYSSACMYANQPSVSAASIIHELSEIRAGSKRLGVTLAQNLYAHLHVTTE